ncbi:ATP-binding protein [Streptomyces sp. HM190]|jgi:serine/threonine-protein kinase RsbW|uniref:ATP-binding protein n=1 Tax=Streptomyces sp. HM190 TaxID=2695266 RepID=UPI000F48B381|nr:ATP-binding protein [Streptomyces sp. HM190]
MRTKWCRAFPGLAEEVGHARRFVAALLEERGPVDDAVLVVSELATNAVRHSLSGAAGGWFVVVVSFGDDSDLVRIEVVDVGGEREPHLCDVTDRDEGGRGLALVAACAKDWGIKSWPDGRTVWADLVREGV